MMQRREFITLLGGAVAAWPLAARAQQPAMPVIGFLSGGSLAGYEPGLVGFRNGLSESGYVEVRNVTIEYRWADGQFDRLPGFADDLVRRRVAVVFASGGVVSALAAKKATSTIPIVFCHGSDPVKFGLVASFNRPGGNITGVSFLAIALEQKRLQIARELIPKTAPIGVLMNPSNPNADVQLNDVQAAVPSLGPIIVLRAGTDGELDRLSEALDQQHLAALVITADSFLFSRQNKITALAERYRVLTITTDREFAAIGALASYGPSMHDSYLQAGI